MSQTQIELNRRSQMRNVLRSIHNHPHLRLEQTPNKEELSNILRAELFEFVASLNLQVMQIVRWKIDWLGEKVSVNVMHTFYSDSKVLVELQDHMKGLTLNELYCMEEDEWSGEFIIKNDWLLPLWYSGDLEFSDEQPVMCYKEARQKLKELLI